MKLLLTFFGIIILISGVTLAIPRQEQKRYKVEMTIQEWDARLSQLEWIKLQVKQSDIPSKNAVLIVDSVLTPLSQQIVYQINMQLKSEQGAKGIKPDSTTKKKN